MIDHDPLPHPAGDLFIESRFIALLFRCTVGADAHIGPRYALTVKPEFTNLLKYS